MIAMKLKNGAEVIAEVRRGDNIYVAAVWNDDEYVTWRCDVEGNAYWGNYFDDRCKALRNLAERALLVTEAIPINDDSEIENVVYIDEDSVPSLMKRQAE